MTGESIKPITPQRRPPFSQMERYAIAEACARYFAGYSFNKHELDQCLGLVDVLIAGNYIGNPRPPIMLDNHCRFLERVLREIASQCHETMVTDVGLEPPTGISLGGVFKIATEALEISESVRRNYV